MKVFISHSSKDITILNKLVKDLASHNIQSWYSERDIEIGDSLIKRLREGLSQVSYCIILLSPNSIKSDWVMLEADTALYHEFQSGKTFLIPVVIESCDIPPFIKNKCYVDFRQNYRLGIKILLEFLLPKKENIATPFGEPEIKSALINKSFEMNPSLIKHFTLAGFFKRDLSHLVRESQCLRKGNFQLTSGKFSSYYIMPRMLLENIPAKNKVIDLLSRIVSITHNDIEAVIYPALTDGSLIGHLVADKMHVKTKIPLNVSVNKREIRLRPIDIEMLSGKRCLYVDDVITTNDGLKIVTEALIQKYTNCLHCYIIYQRS